MLRLEESKDMQQFLQHHYNHVNGLHLIYSELKVTETVVYYFHCCAIGPSCHPSPTEWVGFSEGGEVQHILCITDIYK